MTTAEQSLGIFTTDADLVLRSWDNWMARVTGISADAACGRKLTDLFPELESRGMIKRFNRVLAEGIVEVLAPAFHHYLIPCPPQTPSPHFGNMQQHVTIMPLRENGDIVGLIVTVEDVTARLDRERETGPAQSLPEEAARHAGKLTDALDDEDWRVRKMAVEGLARHGGPEAVRELLRSLRDEHRNLNVLNSALQVLALSDLDVTLSLVEFLDAEDTELRIYAALALGEQRDGRAVAALVGALDDPDSNVRFHTIESLGKLRAVEAVDRLAALAESRDFYLAFPALDALTRISDSRVAPRLVPLLEDDLLRLPAADALGQLGDEESVAPLASLLNKPDTPARLIARALVALYDRYERLYREGAYISDLAARSVTPSGAQNLLDALGDAAPDDLRSLAVVLSWLGGEAVERGLAQLLAQPTVRKEVIEALVRYGRRFTDLFIEHLDSEDFDMRQASVIALGRIGDARAVPALVRLLTEDERLTIAAAGALTRIGDRRAFEPLLGLLGHPDAAVRQAVISALNSVGHPDMAARACSLLADPDPRVRESAVRIAGYFGYTECIDSVLDCCRDDDEGVRRAAIEHLPYIEDSRVLPVLVGALGDATPKLRAAAARAFGHVDSEDALPHLLAALDDADPWVRYFAARSIGRHAGDEGLDVLGRVARADEVGFARVAALEAIGRIGGARAVAILVPLIEAEDRDLSRAALSALGATRHPDALPPLLAALRSPDVARREDAIRALRDHGGTGIASSLQWVAAADADAQVAQAAIDSLAGLATPEAIAALTELTADASRREACVAALAQLSKDRIDSIASGLKHAHAGVRCAIIDVLTRMKHPRASELLSVALDDGEASVRLAAATALGHLGSHFAEKKLSSLARTDLDMAVRRAAQKSLEKM